MYFGEKTNRNHDDHHMHASVMSNDLFKVFTKNKRVDMKTIAKLQFLSLLAQFNLLHRNTSQFFGLLK